MDLQKGQPATHTATVPVLPVENGTGRSLAVFPVMAVGSNAAAHLAQASADTGYASRRARDGAERAHGSQEEHSRPICSRAEQHPSEAALQPSALAAHVLEERELSRQVCFRDEKAGMRHADSIAERQPSLKNSVLSTKKSALLPVDISPIGQRVIQAQKIFVLRIRAKYRPALSRVAVFWGAARGFTEPDHNRLD